MFGFYTHHSNIKLQRQLFTKYIDADTNTNLFKICLKQQNSSLQKKNAKKSNRNQSLWQVLVHNNNAQTKCVEKVLKQMPVS